MITLLERWEAKGFDENLIIRELQFLMNATENWQDIFCYDENDEKIKYCVPYDEDNSYGRETGICYSEESAIDAVKFVLNQYGFLLVPWFRQKDNDQVDLCVELMEPIAYIMQENNAQKEVFDAMFVFEKCRNKAGFCIKNVVPLLGYRRENE